MKDLALSAKRETKAMVDLRKKSTRDARTMKTITLVTLVYLPATLTSVRGSEVFANMSVQKG